MLSFPSVHRQLRGQSRRVSLVRKGTTARLHVPATAPILATVSSCSVEDVFTFEALYSASPTIHLRHYIQHRPKRQISTLGVGVTLKCVVLDDVECTCSASSDYGQIRCIVGDAEYSAKFVFAFFFLFCILSPL